jgi:antirestriction protein ArdC
MRQFGSSRQDWSTEAGSSLSTRVAASVFIAGELGLPTDIPNHASYIEHWLKPLKADKREIFRAAADAQRIADMVLAFIQTLRFR